MLLWHLKSHVLFTRASWWLLNQLYEYLCSLPSLSVSYLLPFFPRLRPSFCPTRNWGAVPTARAQPKCCHDRTVLSVPLPAAAMTSAHCAFPISTKTNAANHSPCPLLRMMLLAHGKVKRIWGVCDSGNFILLPWYYYLILTYLLHFVYVVLNPCISLYLRYLSLHTF